MSTFAVEVVPVELEPHPNADSLSLVRVYGFTVAVRTEDWRGVTTGAYIPPDSVCPDTEQFAFLGDSKRIKARKLRGVWSMGLLVPAPDGTDVGANVADTLGVTHYEPPVLVAGGDETHPPAGYRPAYDVENMRRYSAAFVPGEEVVATEKIHGANGRWVFQDGEFHAGSRTTWRRDAPNSQWWRALRKYPALMDFLRDFPDWTAYGEVYGCVQSLRYGHKDGDVSIALFDIWCDGRECGQHAHWLAYSEFASACSGSGLPRVPELYRGPFDLEALEALADGDTVLGNGTHLREGIVVKPVTERHDDTIGRVQLKLVSNKYLEKS